MNKLKTMKQVTRWTWVFALVGALIWIAGCNDSSSDGGGAVELTIGNNREVSIDANGTNSYKFTPGISGAYRANWNQISTNDSETLSFSSTEPVGCVAAGESQDCFFSNNLESGTSYEFDLVEVSGVDTTFRVGVQTVP